MVSGIREDKEIGTVPRLGYEFKSPGRPIRGLVGALGSVKVAFPAHPQTIFLSSNNLLSSKTKSFHICTYMYVCIQTYVHRYICLCTQTYSMPRARLLQAMYSKLSKNTAAPFCLGKAAETLIKQADPALARESC